MKAVRAMKDTSNVGGGLWTATVLLFSLAFLLSLLSPILLFSQEAEDNEEWLLPPDRGVVLDNTIRWHTSNPKESERRFTDLAAVMRADGSAPCFIVVQPGTYGSWRHSIDLPIRSGRFPVITMQYRAFGTASWSPEPVLACTVGTGDNQRTVSLIEISELKADGTPQEVTKNLRPVIGDDHITALHIRLECLAEGDQEACLLLTSISFSADKKALQRATGLPAARPIPVRVLDLQGKPVEDAVVVADIERMNFVRWTQTGADGTASLTPVPNESGRHTVRVVVEGYVETEVLYVPGETPTPVTLPLIPGTHCGGMVLDGEGNGVANVVVRVKAEAYIPDGVRCLRTHKVLTDQKGAWLTPPVPATANPLRVGLACPEYANKFKDVALWCDDDLFVSVVEEGAVFRIPDFAALAAKSRRTWAREVDKLDEATLKHWITDPKRPETSRTLALDAFQRRLSLVPNGRSSALPFFIEWSVSDESEKFAHVAMKHALGAVRARYGHLAWAEAAIQAECDPRLAQQALAIAKPLLDMYRSSVTTARPASEAEQITGVLLPRPAAVELPRPVTASRTARVLPTWTRLTHSGPQGSKSDSFPIRVRPVQAVAALPAAIAPTRATAIRPIQLHRPSMPTVAGEPIVPQTPTAHTDLPVISPRTETDHLSPIVPQKSQTGDSTLVAFVPRTTPSDQPGALAISRQSPSTGTGLAPIVPQRSQTGDSTLVAFVPRTTPSDQPGALAISRQSPSAGTGLAPIVPQKSQTGDSTLVAFVPRTTPSDQPGALAISRQSPSAGTGLAPIVPQKSQPGDSTLVAFVPRTTPSDQPGALAISRQSPSAGTGLAPIVPQKSQTGDSTLVAFDPEKSRVPTSAIHSISVSGPLHSEAELGAIALKPDAGGTGLAPLLDVGSALDSVSRETEKREEVLDLALVEQGAVEIDDLITEGKREQAIERCQELARKYVRGSQSCLSILGLLAKAQPSTPRPGATTVESTFLSCFPTDDPRRPVAEYSVALYLYKSNQAQQACDRLAAFINKEPDGDLQIRAALTLGLCQIRIGQRKEALASLKGLLERAPHAEEAAKAQFLVGWLHMTQQETAEANKAFAAVVRNHPDSPYAEKAGELLTQTGGR